MPLFEAELERTASTVWPLDKANCTRPRFPVRQARCSGMVGKDGIVTASARVKADEIPKSEGRYDILVNKRIRNVGEISHIRPTTPQNCYVHLFYSRVRGHVDVKGSGYGE